MVLKIYIGNNENGEKTVTLCVLLYVCYIVHIHIRIIHYNNTDTECLRFVNEQTMLVNYRQLIFPSALHDIGHHC